MTDQALREKLSQARAGILTLHRALLAAEREAWERMNGRQLGNAELLQMTIADPWFSWLQPLTTLIALMDEVMNEANDDSEVKIPVLLESARALAHPDDDGSDFQQRYYEFVQRSPDVAVAYGIATKALSER